MLSAGDKKATVVLYISEFFTDYKKIETFFHPFQCILYFGKEQSPKKAGLENRSIMFLVAGSYCSRSLFLQLSEKIDDEKRRKNYVYH
jgi:hypothetical protein